MVYFNQIGKARVVAGYQEICQCNLSNQQIKRKTI